MHTNIYTYVRIHIGKIFKNFQGYEEKGRPNEKSN